MLTRKPLVRPNLQPAARQRAEMPHCQFHDVGRVLTHNPVKMRTGLGAVAGEETVDGEGVAGATSRRVVRTCVAQCIDMGQSSVRKQLICAG